MSEKIEYEIDQTKAESFEKYSFSEKRISTEFDESEKNIDIVMSSHSCFNFKCDLLLII
jgi:hypothetical protein